jgi:hypothetical protein
MFFLDSNRHTPHGLYNHGVYSRLSRQARQRLRDDDLSLTRKKTRAMLIKNSPCYTTIFWLTEHVETTLCSSNLTALVP